MAILQAATVVGPGTVYIAQWPLGSTSILMPFRTTPERCKIQIPLVESDFNPLLKPSLGYNPPPKTLGSEFRIAASVHFWNSPSAPRITYEHAPYQTETPHTNCSRRVLLS